MRSCIAQGMTVECLRSRPVEHPSGNSDRGKHPGDAVRSRMASNAVHFHRKAHDAPVLLTAGDCMISGSDIDERNIRATAGVGTTPPGHRRDMAASVGRAVPDDIGRAH